MAAALFSVSIKKGMIGEEVSSGLGPTLIITESCLRYNDRFSASQSLGNTVNSNALGSNSPRAHPKHYFFLDEDFSLCERALPAMLLVLALDLPS